MVTIPELPSQSSGNVTDDDLLVTYDMGAGQGRKVTRAAFLTGVARSGQDATLGAINADELNAPTGAIDTLTVATELVMGARVSNIVYLSSLVAVPTVAAGAQGTVTVTLTGSVTGDMLMVNATALDAGLILSGTVTSANTVTLYFWNASAAPIAGANRIIRLMAMRCSP